MDAEPGEPLGAVELTAKGRERADHHSAEEPSAKRNRIQGPSGLPCVALPEAEDKQQKAEATTGDEDRAAADPMLWYQIAGKVDHMHVKLGTTVSQLRRKIKDDNKNTLDRVDAKDITIKNHEGKALEVDELINDVLKQGGTSTTTALSVHYEQPSASAATGSVSASDQQQVTDGMIDTMILNRQLQKPRHEDVRDLLYRGEQVQQVCKYIAKVKKGLSSDQAVFPLIGTSGIKGIGKTQLLLNCLAMKYEEAGQEKLIANAKSVYVTFNGQGNLKDRFISSLAFSHAYDTAFGHAFLAACGLDEQLARTCDFATSIRIIRKLCGAVHDDMLVVFVDELGLLDEDMSGDNKPVVPLLKALMGCMDKENGKLVFVFSHLLESMLKVGATSGSGRRIESIPLMALPENIWNEAPAFSAWNQAAKWAGVHQLLLSCAGHPRCLFDGLKAALEENPTLLKTEPNAVALDAARNTIINECKFDGLQYNLGEKVHQWFNVLDSMDPESLKRHGLCISVAKTSPGNIELFHPLVLNWWARKNAADSRLAFHLQRAYEFDAELAKGSEQRMEGLMYHYECVLRLALDGQLVALTKFYNTKYIAADLQGKKLVAKLPEGGARLVAYFEDFTHDLLAIKSRLEQGCVVVSKKQGEVGIEYLSPWTTSDGKLLVACVQCKFVQTQTCWAQIKEKMRIAERQFTDAGIDTFRVIYATPDQATITRDVYEDGVYFNEMAVFGFTIKLGILRLHTQKLGGHLSDEVPILASRSS